MTTTAPSPLDVPLGILQRLRALRDRWAEASAAERANYQLYLIELTEALGVERPHPATAADPIAPHAAYQFEYPVRAIGRDGDESTNFIDLYFAGHFALEAKDQEAGASSTRFLTKAFGQVNGYARDLPERPPYILVLDVGKQLLVWDRWSGSYGGFNAARRIDLATLADRPDDIQLLRDIWTNPSARDPRARAQAVTQEIAAKLAQLAAALETRGHDQEQVARFLMRCVFSCFAEDVGLLPDEVFRKTVEGLGLRGTPEEFSTAVTALWRTMDEGGWFGALQLRRFNGHFFRSIEALPLTKSDIALLIEAARADWARVEPTIFGTLLVRALDPEERHRLGAEYTPRAFIERVVRPTVEEPIRERWTAVQAEVLQLRESGRAADRRKAEKQLRVFHEWLRGLQFLDPACGSGNFLYVTLEIVKRIELEVMRTIVELTGQHALRFEEVGPWQFHGIEIKPWAREIAELTLWIGFHQFWREHHDVQPDEPILQDTGTLECRDAVLAWDSIRHDPTRDRPDPTPRIPNPVTGELVPDPARRLHYEEHVGAQPAPWPDADFIIGNPPYLGVQRQRDVFGDGYVDALRAAYPELPDGTDFVMYWWHRAARCVAEGRTVRAGLITTNSIVQTQNRSIVAAAAESGARVAWAIPDHVWYDGSDGAEVRVAMTVIAKNPPSATLVSVERVERVWGDVPIVSQVQVPALNADLTAHADVASAATKPLNANAGLSYRGVCVVGNGFFLSGDEGRQLLSTDVRNADVIRRIRNGKDLTARPRDVFLIDFGLRSEQEARSYAVIFDLARDRVKPERDANPRATYRRYWWRFGEPRREVRGAVIGLPRYIVTAMTAKHRTFHFVPSDVLPDQGVIAIASDDAYLLGVLSSTIHQSWALAAGGRMGVRHTPRYNNAVCFDPFPFPDPSPELRLRIATLAERLEAHRHAALARDESVTIMKMYDALNARRSGAPMTPAMRAVHELAACGILGELHDELDQLVAEAYGWSWPLEREPILEHLVRLQEERMLEEQRGMVRWLRPEFQASGGRVQLATELALVSRDSDHEDEEERDRTLPWPAEAVEQIAALKRLAATRAVSTTEAARCFSSAREEIVGRHLETLAILGELRLRPDGRYASAPLPY